MTLADDLVARSREPLDAATAERLVALVHLLCETPVGVTAVRDPAQALERHVLDSLAGLPEVDRAPPGPLADVGSGGGVPALVLAAVRPAREVHAVEATRRKADWIAEASRRLGIPVTVHAGRSEALARGPLREVFAVVCARALAPPPVAAELCLPLCAVGGRVLLWSRERELAPTAAAAAELGGELVPSAAEGIVAVVKRRPSPAAYPRREGMAAKRPLGAG
jgi:16S rRNA (guanine527-N7)-methyltransferase